MSEQEALATLVVRLGERRVGCLRRSRRGGWFAFTYDAEWLASADAVPLSRSLPLGEAELPHEACLPFFGGLLPEGGVRLAVARRLGVSERNDFALLDALGGDCAGAVTIGPSADVPAGRREIRWLDDAAEEAWLGELPSRPFHAGETLGVRLSLAGAQDKAPMCFDGERYGVPVGGQPSTHIVKLPIDGFPDTVVNEAAGLQFVGLLGIPAVAATPDRRGALELLRVTRYDRTSEGERLHQEDVCQALGYPPGTKYEAEGGPGIAAVIALLRRVATQPAVATRAFLDRVVASYLVGNADGHAKNVSLLYIGRSVDLAPAYDVVSTAVYPQHATKLAMRIGGEYRPERVDRRHWERMVDEAGFGRAYLRHVARLAELAPGAIREACDDLRRDGWDSPVLDQIQEVVAERAARVRHALAA